ncbi:hypothetical protein DFH11DRAFT_304549 [Phellopilus nigrolimitatus]|nr:hypothetical protein DFH11DRAFT_304549 [Phellopilus nigrolimitatus]
MVTTRKSTGRLPPPRLDQNLDQGQDSEDEEEVEIEAQRPKKRRKTSKGTRKSGVEADASFIPTSVVNPGSRRRQAGKLALIMSMPVDVFCEIAAHLSPEDLLRMARSTKVLRNFLMSKDSKLIWHKAEEASGMPICPSDLSSPQYASLIFDKHCTHCNSVRSSRLEVGLRVRLCKKCHNKNVRYGLKLMSPKPTSLSDSEWISILKLVPGSGYWHAKGFQTLTLDVMLELKYYRPTFESTFEKYQALGCTPDKQKVFVEEKHKMTREAWLHTAELDDWLDDIEEQKHEDRQALKSRRKDSILGKLEELGYSRADFNTELDERGWRWNALVEQPRELTDKAWNNLHPRLEQIIHLRREKKAQREKEDRVRAREKRLLELVKDFIQSDTSFILSVLAPELLEFPLAREIVDNDDLPIEFSLDILYPLKGELIATSNARILEIETNLIPKICSVSSVESKDIDKNPILRHATTFFYIDLDSYETTPTTLHKILADLQAQCRNSFNYAFKYSFASLWQPASITPSPS